MVSSEEQGRAAFQKFCKVIGLDGLLQDPYFAEKGFRTIGVGRDAQEMKPLYETAFENWDALELVNTIDKCGGVAAPLLSYKDLFDPLHEQVKANRMVVEQNHPRAGRIKLINNPWRHTDGAAEIKSPAPALGEQTDEILTSLGYPDARIKKLRDLGIAK